MTRLAESPSDNTVSSNTAAVSTVSVERVEDGSRLPVARLVNARIPPDDSAGMYTRQREYRDHHSLEGSDLSIARPEPIARMKIIPPQPPSYELATVVQAWEGYVVEIGNETFTARLLDQTRKMSTDTEIAEIPISEVDPGDLDLVKEGSIFYLTIKRRVLKNGRHETASAIVFRRLPAWHRVTLERAKDKAKLMAAYFAEPV